ncbi:MAG: hypothetical protein ACE5GE_03730 [Phycisphaerae bacterium]
MSQTDTRLKTVTILVLTAAIIGRADVCSAIPVWFDETGGGSPYADMTELAGAYNTFLGPTTSLVTFNNLSVGSVVTDQYAGTDGVSFSNTSGTFRRTNSGIFNEGDRPIGDLTGYDGSLLPDADPILVKFANNDPTAPLTIFFDQPVVSVGAFVGVGGRGRNRTVTVSAFDENGALLSQHTVQTQPWEKRPRRQNFESFFALRSDTANIARVEILNNAKRKNLGSAVMIDNVALRRPSSGLPEPATGLLLSMGMVGLVLHRARRWRGCR